MTCLDFSNTYGNMCNHFYLAYQAFQASKKLKEDVKYIKTNSFNKFNLQDTFDIFNLSQFVIDKNKIGPQDRIIKNTDNWYGRYHQIIFIDFNIENIELFIKNTFLSTNLFQFDDNKYKNCIAIHIRNCDYLNDNFKQFNCFNRKKYIKNSLNIISNTINKIYVYSDDIDFCKKEYGMIFNNRFQNVIYMGGNSAINDFIELSKFRNKILWNSTFSYWSAFIGNVLHPNSYDNVIAPSKFEIGEPLCNHLNPMWRIINV